MTGRCVGGPLRVRTELVGDPALSIDRPPTAEEVRRDLRKQRFAAWIGLDDPLVAMGLRGSVHVRLENPARPFGSIAR